MVDKGEFLFIIGAIHEMAHIWACRLMRVAVVRVHLSKSECVLPSIDIEECGFLKTKFICFAPSFLELFVGMRILDGFFRVLWLQIWLKASMRCFPRVFLSEMKNSTSKEVIAGHE